MPRQGEQERKLLYSRLRVELGFPDTWKFYWDKMRFFVGNPSRLTLTRGSDYHLEPLTSAPFVTDGMQFTNVIPFVEETLARFGLDRMWAASQMAVTRASAKGKDRGSFLAVMIGLARKLHFDGPLMQIPWLEPRSYELNDKGYRHPARADAHHDFYNIFVSHWVKPQELQDNTISLEVTQTICEAVFRCKGATYQSAVKRGPFSDEEVKIIKDVVAIWLEMVPDFVDLAKYITNDLQDTIGAVGTGTKTEASDEGSQAVKAYAEELDGVLQQHHGTTGLREAAAEARGDLTRRKRVQLPAQLLLRVIGLRLGRLWIAVDPKSKLQLTSAAESLKNQLSRAVESGRLCFTRNLAPDSTSHSAALSAPAPTSVAPTFRSLTSSAIERDRLYRSYQLLPKELRTPCIDMPSLDHLYRNLLQWESAGHTARREKTAFFDALIRNYLPQAARFTRTDLRAKMVRFASEQLLGRIDTGKLPPSARVWILKLFIEAGPGSQVDTAIAIRRKGFYPSIGSIVWHIYAQPIAVQEAISRILKSSCPRWWKSMNLPIDPREAVVGMKIAKGFHMRARKEKKTHAGSGDDEDEEEEGDEDGGGDISEAEQAVDGVKDLLKINRIEDMFQQDQHDATLPDKVFETVEELSAWIAQIWSTEGMTENDILDRQMTHSAIATRQIDVLYMVPK